MVEHNKCSGCSACLNACPVQCISMKPDGLGFLYPVIDETACIHCGRCEKVCPALDENRPDSPEPKAFAGHAKDENIRDASSSGGVFSLLAANVLEKGGVVFGAALTGDCSSVKHIRVDNTDDLAKLRGSKYVQSDVGRVFSEVKELLQANRYVLFSGTPCQIDGLRHYLQKDYDNLLLVEVMCHGVPSPNIYQKYLAWVKEKLQADIAHVFFRDEKKSGGLLKIRVISCDGNEYKSDSAKDPFFRMFLKNICLRESCYCCSARGLHPRADITIADYWGVEEYSPELVDGKEISLLLLHNNKGKINYYEIAEQFKGEEIPFQLAILRNPVFFRSCERPDSRNYIEADSEVLSIPQLENKYTYGGKKNLIILLGRLHIINPIKKINSFFKMKFVFPLWKN